MYSLATIMQGCTTCIQSVQGYVHLSKDDHNVVRRLMQGCHKLAVATILLQCCHNLEISIWAVVYILAT